MQKNKNYSGIKSETGSGFSICISARRYIITLFIVWGRYYWFIYFYYVEIRVESFIRFFTTVRFEEVRLKCVWRLNTSVEKLRAFCNSNNTVYNVNGYFSNLDYFNEKSFIICILSECTVNQFYSEKLFSSIKKTISWIFDNVVWKIFYTPKNTFSHNDIIISFDFNFFFFKKTR